MSIEEVTSSGGAGVTNRRTKRNVREQDAGFVLYNNNNGGREQDAGCGHNN